LDCSKLNNCSDVEPKLRIRLDYIDLIRLSCGDILLPDSMEKNSESGAVSQIWWGGSGGCRLRAASSLLVGMRLDSGIGIGQEWGRGDGYSKEFMGSNGSNGSKYHASQI
jgi:hypothetical protein